MAYFAMLYAQRLGADAINASWGFTLDTNTVRTACPEIFGGLSIKNYKNLVEMFERGARRLDLGQTLLVAAAANCVLDAASVYHWPAGIDNRNVIMVSNVSSGGDLLGMYGDRVNIFAVGESQNVLAPGNTTGKCQGTSVAAPYVTGAIGLILAKPAGKPNPLGRDKAGLVIRQLQCNATKFASAPPAMPGTTRPLLNVEAAVKDFAGECVSIE